MSYYTPDKAAERLLGGIRNIISKGNRPVLLGEEEETDLHKNAGQHS